MAKPDEVLQDVFTSDQPTVIVTATQEDYRRLRRYFGEAQSDMGHVAVVLLPRSDQEPRLIVFGDT